MKPKPTHIEAVAKGYTCAVCDPGEPHPDVDWCDACVPHPYIEKVLALSTAHMPNTTPDFGGLRVVRFEYGVVVWVAEPGEGVPEWITPALTLAYETECTLLLLDRDCNKDPNLPTWDW